MRDYIHVVDLAKGHIAALNKLQSDPGCVVYNLGTGLPRRFEDAVLGFHATLQSSR